MTNYDTNTQPGETRRDWRHLSMRQAPNGIIRIEVLERDLTRRTDGTEVATDLGGLPTPYDPAELVEVPGLGPVPAGGIVAAVSAWIRAKQIARDESISPPSPE